MLDTKKISHDIRNPLNTIVVNAELGGLLIDTNADAQEIKKIFLTIINESEKISEILKSELDTGD